MSKKDQPTASSGPRVVRGRGRSADPCTRAGHKPECLDCPRSPVRVLQPTGGLQPEPGGDQVTDMDLAWVYLRGMLACLQDQAEVERQVEAAPALAVLLSYRHAAHRAAKLGVQ